MLQEWNAIANELDIERLVVLCSLHIYSLSSKYIALANEHKLSPANRKKVISCHLEIKSVPNRNIQAA